MANLVADGAARLEPKQPSIAIAHDKPMHAFPDGHDAVPAPLSFAQQRIYFLDQIGSGAAYNMSASLWLTGPLDERALALALDEIRRRHEILRTTFQHARRAAGATGFGAAGDRACGARSCRTSRVGAHLGSDAPRHGRGQSTVRSGERPAVSCQAHSIEPGGEPCCF